MIDFASKPLFLAPLAGLSDKPLRTMVKELGCDVTVSEMISSNALVYESKKSLQMLSKSSKESPYIVQLAGSDKEIIKKAVEIINELHEIDGIDLNCGCPVPKVIKQGAGSALLMESKKLCEIIEIIKKTSNKKYTSAKLRLGFNKANLIDFVKDIQNAGADFIVVHARTKTGGFSAKPDYEMLRKIKEKISIPLIANGAIDENNYKEVLQISNCDGLMIGQGAIGKPWIFDTIKGKKQPNKTQIKELILKHLTLMREYYKDHAVAVFRKHLHAYSKGYNASGVFREKINKLDDFKLVEDQIRQFF